MKGIMRYHLVTVILLFFVTPASFSQVSEDKGHSNKKFMLRLSDQDILSPISSIEWGHPDRWSFTSRYIHSFHKEKNRRTWHHNLSASISPGLSGGRIGMGYLGLYDPASLKDFGLFYELKGVFLRTWGNPLSAPAKTNYAGVELKICISWIFNASVGYYLPISNSSKHQDFFWGIHFGIGI